MNSSFNFILCKLLDFAIVKIHFYIVISFAYLPQGSSEVEVNHWDLIQLKVIESVDVLGDKMWTLGRLKKTNYPHFILANQMEIYFLFQYHSYFAVPFIFFIPLPISMFFPLHFVIFNPSFYCQFR